MSSIRAALIAASEPREAEEEEEEEAPVEEEDMRGTTSDSKRASMALGEEGRVRWKSEERGLGV